MNAMLFSKTFCRKLLCLGIFFLSLLIILTSIFVSFFHVSFYFCFVWVGFFVVCLFIWFGGRENTQSWVTEEMGRTWEELEEEENMIKAHPVSTGMTEYHR